MKIHLYTVAWNEEYIMPYFLRHYSKFCDKIFVYDNESTDSTVDIVKSFPNTEVKSFKSEDKFNDLANLYIKSNMYKQSRGEADWVIVVDADEFIYYPNIKEKLSEYDQQGINFPKIIGYEMMPGCELDSNDDLPEKYKLGTRFINLDKRAIFKPELDMKYGVGCHFAEIPQGAKESQSQEIKLLHYKMINMDYFIQRHQTLNKRLSDINKQKGWGIHYSWTKNQMIENYNSFFYKREKII